MKLRFKILAKKTIQIFYWPDIHNNKTKTQNRKLSQILVKNLNHIGIHVDYAELRAQVMKTFLEPQRHGTSKEEKKSSCI